MQEFTFFVTETIIREVEYSVYGTDKEDAHKNFENGEFVDSWTVGEDIEEIIVHRVTLVTEEE